MCRCLEKLAKLSENSEQLDGDISGVLGSWQLSCMCRHSVARLLHFFPDSLLQSFSVTRILGTYLPELC